LGRRGAAYLRYDGDVSVDIPIAGLATAGLDVEVDSVLLGGFYTFDLPAEGLYYSLGGFLPYIWMDAEAEVVAAPGTFRRRDSASGVGDLTIIPGMLAWKRGSRRPLALRGRLRVVEGRSLPDAVDRAGHLRPRDRQRSLHPRERRRPPTVVST
jgi:hypothetical protein